MERKAVADKMMTWLNLAKETDAYDINVPVPLLKEIHDVLTAKSIPIWYPMALGWECNACGEVIHSTDHYCPSCGTFLDWDNEKTYGEDDK